MLVTAVDMVQGMFFKVAVVLGMTFLSVTRIMQYLCFMFSPFAEVDPVPDVLLNFGLECFLARM